MQFYIEREIKAKELIAALGQLLALRLETSDLPDPEAKAFLMVSLFKSGFRTGATVAWGPNVQPKIGRLEAARGLAKSLQTRVATDLPEGHSETRDPYIWAVATPDGKVFQIGEDVRKSDEEQGLSLDERTKKDLRLD